MVKKSVVFYWTYRLALWISVLWSALSVIATQGWGTEALDPLLSLAPGQSVDLGWIVPTAIAAVIGLVIDIATKAGEKHAAANPPAEESTEADALAEA